MGQWYLTKFMVDTAWDSRFMFIFPAKMHSRHPGAGVGGVAEAAGCLALLGGGEVSRAEVVPGLQAGVAHQPRGGGAGELGGDRCNT